MTRMLCAVAVAVLAGGATAGPADDVKVELKAFKWEAKGGGNDELGGFDEGQDRFFFYTFGTATGDIAVPDAGEYTITIDAGCTEAKKVFAAFKLTVGEVVVAKEHFLKAEENKPQVFTATLKAGKQKMVIEFLNDEYKDGEYDRNLFVHGVKVEKKK